MSGMYDTSNTKKRIGGGLVGFTILLITIICILEYSQNDNDNNTNRNSLRKNVKVNEIEVVNVGNTIDVITKHRFTLSNTNEEDNDECVDWLGRVTVNYNNNSRERTCKFMMGMG